MAEGENAPNHVPAKELLKQDPASLTPQQAARALVKNQRLALRSGIVHALTPEKMERVVGKLIERASNGHVASAKLLFEYAVGKPEEEAAGAGTGGPAYQININLTAPRPVVVEDVEARPLGDADA